MNITQTNSSVVMKNNIKQYKCMNYINIRHTHSKEEISIIDKNVPLSEGNKTHFHWNLNKRILFILFILSNCCPTSLARNDCFTNDSLLTQSRSCYILGCLINTRTYTLFRAKKFIAFICCKLFGPEQCICPGIYETT